MADEASLAHTPTWVVAAVCLTIVSVSLVAERFLHYLGKWLKHKDQKAVFSALQRLKEELLLLGFVSFLLSLSEGFIVHICIPEPATRFMLPCKKDTYGASEENTKLCKKKGDAPFLSLEALHQLHILVFTFGLVHVLFCATTILLGGAKIRKWKHWEKAIHREIMKLPKKELESQTTPLNAVLHQNHQGIFVRERTKGFWMKLAVVSWTVAFLKQFYDSVSKSDYEVLRSTFVLRHIPRKLDFDFHKYMMGALEHDLKILVGISGYLWLFVIFFLLLNINGWHTYFWLPFLPLFLLLIVGAKLEHIITRLAQEVAASLSDGTVVDPKIRMSNERFWFGKPGLVLHLIHFVLFQNSFEISFFFMVMDLGNSNDNFFRETNNDHSIGIRRVRFVHDGKEGFCHFQTCCRYYHRSDRQLHHPAIIRHRYPYERRHQAARSRLETARVYPRLGYRGPEEANLEEGQRQRHGPRRLRCGERKRNPGAQRAVRKLRQHADGGVPGARRDRHRR